jgi:hypothetical protein
MSDERHELILVCPRRRHSRKHGLLAFATTSAPSSPSKGMAALMHSKPFLELGTGQCAMQGTMERLKERYVCVCSKNCNSARKANFVSSAGVDNSNGTLYRVG